MQMHYEGEERRREVTRDRRQRRMRMEALEAIDERQAGRFGGVAHKLSDWLSLRSFLDRWVDRRNISHRVARKIVVEERHNRHAIRKAELPQRVIAAVLGGALLIALMSIMSINQTRKKSLITSSVAVYVFGLGLAFFSSVKVSELLAALAAYAAVLVVFVGVSGP